MLRSNVETVEKRIETIDIEQEDLCQYLRRDCLEIHGIPETPYESTDQIVKDIGKLIDVSIGDGDISISHRLPSRRKNGRPQVIIAKFVQRTTRDSLYNARRVLKDFDTTKLGHAYSSKNKIFLNESLTPRSRALFYEVRQFQKTEQFKSSWTKNGQVYLRKDSESDKICFNTLTKFQEFKDNFEV